MTTQTARPASEPTKEIAKITGQSLLAKYQRAFETLLPSHVDPKQWMGVAYGTLRVNPELRAAAEASPGSFMSAMMTSARLGLEPGTPEYWLTVRKRKGRPEVLGIIGYQGQIEMIYRAGAVASVIVECVYEKDGFTFVPGRDERPVHHIDWFGGNRGNLIGVYAYGVMMNGSTSKVVILGQHDIDRVKQSADSSASQYSPWNTHEASMWMKTAVRQLQKWIPTSSEYRRQALRDAQTVAREHDLGDAVVQTLQSQQDAPDIEAVDAEVIDPETGEVTA